VQFPSEDITPPKILTPIIEVTINFVHIRVTVVATELPLAPMTDPRPNSAPYDMRCPIARTLDIVGERWTILILRDLVTGGPRKFQDFERSLDGISPNTLSARLKRLEEAGIVERHFYEQHPPRAEYLLTKKGDELRPVLKTLFDWGQRHTRYGGSDK
jgi:DNA-binding HxlR family transcriptional regulator